MKRTFMIRKWGLPIALLCGFIGFYSSNLPNLITWQSVTLHYAEISNFLEQNRSTSYTGFLFFYTLVVAFSIPVASLLTLFAGAIIGWPAIGLIVVAATTGASVVFIAARGLFHDLFRARAGPFFEKVEARFTHNAFGFMLFLRLMPIVPFWVVNILPAFSRIRFLQFVCATAVGIIPGTSIYVAVGRGLSHALALDQPPNLAELSAPQIWMPLVGLAIFILLPTLYRQFTQLEKK